MSEERRGHGGEVSWIGEGSFVEPRKEQWHEFDGILLTFIYPQVIPEDGILHALKYTPYAPCHKRSSWIVREPRRLTISVQHVPEALLVLE